jgi:hypothetical protein
VLVASGSGGDPRSVLVHPRRSREVRPRQVGDHPALDSELSEHVSPASEEPFLLGSGFDDELRSRDRDDRSEGVALAVPHRAEKLTGPPLEVDDVEPVKTRRQ